MRHTWYNAEITPITSFMGQCCTAYLFFYLDVARGMASCCPLGTGGQARSSRLHWLALLANAGRHEDRIGRYL